MEANPGLVHALTFGLLQTSTDRVVLMAKDCHLCEGGRRSRQIITKTAQLAFL